MEKQLEDQVFLITAFPMEFGKAVSLHLASFGVAFLLITLN
jgi:hypothetical protein